MKQAKKRVRIFVPRNVLQELLGRPGGKSRDDAVAGALEQIETLRDASLAALDATIEAVEIAARGPATGRFAPADLENMLQQADLIVTLAGTFGLEHLDAAARSLCDLTYVLLQIGRTDAEPVRVHARALRLFSPKNPPLSAKEAQLVLAELARFRSYFGAKSLLAAESE